jgi:hypothetical protein
MCARCAVDTWCGRRYNYLVLLYHSLLICGICIEVHIYVCAGKYYLMNSTNLNVMTFCWFGVYMCFLFSIRICNLRICVSKHLDSNHQLLCTASFSPQPAFQKSSSEKSRTKQALNLCQKVVGP